MRSIFAGCVCLFYGHAKKKKIKLGFRKEKEKVVGVSVLEGDKRTVCDMCRYRVEKSWKGGMSIETFLYSLKLYKK